MAVVGNRQRHSTHKGTPRETFNTSSQALRVYRKVKKVGHKYKIKIPKHTALSR
jgi:hypothetical protein